MYQIFSTPAIETDAFEAESLASTRRATAPETPQPTLRSFALIVARCESAATLLGWRKQMTPDQKRRLDAAIHSLQEAAARVAVRPSAPPSVPQRAKRGPLFSAPRR
jgi:hypothetical protein